MNEKLYEESFNLLCGDKIGQGIARTVFKCKLNSNWVVKVEDQDYRTFQNIYEMKFWDDNFHFEKIKKWLAPCYFLSPDGRILIQQKCHPATKKDFPEKIPSFLTDIKLDNFGIFNEKLVCFDYGLHVNNPSVAMKKVVFYEDVDF